jgi:hypothetical protein
MITGGDVRGGAGPHQGRARAARMAAAVPGWAAGQVCRWPWRVDQNRWPLVYTVRAAVTEMTAYFSAVAV